MLKKACCQPGLRAARARAVMTRRRQVREFMPCTPASAVRSSRVKSEVAEHHLSGVHFGAYTEMRAIRRTWRSPLHGGAAIAYRRSGPRWRCSVSCGSMPARRKRVSACGAVSHHAILGETMRPELSIMPGGHVVVALSGEIDIATAPAARDLLAEATSEGVTGITVDLGQVTFMDAAGLGVLASASKAARHLPEGLRLAAVPPRVLRLLRLTGLDCLAAFPSCGSHGVAFRSLTPLRCIHPGPCHWDQRSAICPARSARFRSRLISAG